MSKEIVQITDYNINLDLLISQYKNKENFKGILQAQNSQANDLEDAIFEVRDEFWLSTAEGDQLDIIGSIHKETRQGRNDTDYRAAINVRIVLNNGSGEAETIIKALTDLFGATTVQIQNQYNATLYIWADIVLTETQFNTLVNFTAAGVEVNAIVGSSNPFVFDGDSDGTGFGKLSDNDTIFLDTAGDTVQDTDGNDIYFLVNEADEDEGGEFQGVWTTN